MSRRLWLLLILVIIVALFLGGITNDKIFESTYSGHEELIQPTPTFSAPCNEVYLPESAQTNRVDHGGWPYRATVASVRDVLWTCDDQGSVKKYNPQFNDTDFGKTAEYKKDQTLWTSPFIIVGLIAWLAYAHKRKVSR